MTPLRAFYRQFSPGRVPGLYYDVLRGTAHIGALFSRFPEQTKKASAEAWHAELGVTEHREVRSRIKTALGDAAEWILIGGQQALIDQPDAGDIVRGSGGVRKIRWGLDGRGKRGGIRVIYYVKARREEIWMLTLYAKNEEQSIPAHILKKIKEEIDGGA